jgi:hypothetical protein
MGKKIGFHFENVDGVAVSLRGMYRNSDSDESCASEVMD